MFVVLVLLLAVLGVFVVRNYQLRDGAPVRDDSGEMPRGGTVTVRLAVAGDMVMHMGLNEQAYDEATDSYDYTDIMSGAFDELVGADYAVCCLETTFPNTTEYTGYPYFRSPKDLCDSIRAVGIDLVSTASNHCVDGYQSGMVRTIEALDERGIAHVGTYASQEAREENNGIYVADVNGASIAFLAYTYGTNGMPVDGFEYMANIFFKDYLTDLSVIDYDMLDADLAAARALDTDFIAVFMHWGHEYATQPCAYQEELADYLFSQGADMILGGHTHVPEPMEIRTIEEEDGSTRQGLLLYSLGNFLSTMDDPYTMLTAVVTVTLEKDMDTGRARLVDASYRPMFMADTRDYDQPVEWRYRLLDVLEEIRGFEAGQAHSYLSDGMYDDILAARRDLQTIMGAEYEAASEEPQGELVA